MCPSSAWEAAEAEAREVGAMAEARVAEARVVVVMVAAREAVRAVVATELGRSAA
jgi:3-hydroxyisobutyrate dehydrogenase-like beta-hydroxyacid dehydrogenase